MQKEFTGRHMLVAMIGGFAIIISVNFFMASLAIRGFGGVIVENTYVASQKFNDWLAEARRQDALGWNARLVRTPDGYLVIKTESVPDMALASADIRRPLGELEPGKLALTRQSDGSFRSETPLAEGRWIVRLEITSSGESWRKEYQLP